MNKVKDKLPALVEEELAAAMEEHPIFASMHEGYAVLLEEVEETEAEMQRVRFHMDRLWKLVKQDCSADYIASAAATVLTNACDMAAEAIQVAAMSQKILVSLGLLDDFKKVAP